MYSPHDGAGCGDFDFDLVATILVFSVLYSIPILMSCECKIGGSLDQKIDSIGGRRATTATTAMPWWEIATAFNNWFMHDVGPGPKLLQPRIAINVHKTHTHT